MKAPALSPAHLSRHSAAQVVELIHDHLAEELTLVGFAAVVGLSPAAFCRAFSTRTGNPPHRFLLNLRIERALGLLEQGTLPDAEVAALVGYDDPSYFARLSKRHTRATLLSHRRDRLP